MGSSWSSSGVNERAMVLCSSLSLVSTTFVLMVFALNRDLLRKSYQRLIFCSILSDLLCSTGSITGLHYSNSPACLYQWFTTNYFALTSLFFNMTLMVEIYCNTILNMKLDKYYIYFYVFNWTFPLAVTLLPLTTDKVGTNKPYIDDDDDNYGDWCYLYPNVPNHYDSLSYKIWNIISFFAWLWFANIIFILIYLRIIFYMWCSPKVGAVDVGTKALKVIIRLATYPLIINAAYFSQSISAMVETIYGQGAPLQNNPYRYLYFNIKNIFYSLSHTHSLCLSLFTTFSLKLRLCVRFFMRYWLYLISCILYE